MTRDRHSVRCLAVAGLVLLGLLAPVAASRVDAQQDAGSGWMPTGLTTPVQQLLVAGGSTLFARTSGGLVRSGDGGTTWAAVALPPAPPPGPGATAVRQDVAVDPFDPTVLYAAGADGLYRSDDGAGSWRVALPTAARVLALAASPAERGLLYLALADDPRGDRNLLRSRDGGATWEEASSSRQVPSRCGRDLLVPHPSDAGAVLTMACGGGPTQNVWRSTDQGATWADTALCPPRTTDCFGYVDRLVISPSGAGQRAYLSTINAGATRPGSVVLRSDDAGQSWAAVLDTRGSTPTITLRGLAVDPSDPDHVYVAPEDGALGVRRSVDGGATWTALGGEGLGTIADLALSSDGASLYAATARGLWRRRLQ